MVEYRHLNNEEQEELIDLIDLVFQSDFKTLLPKVFDSDLNPLEDITKVAVNDAGKLVAAVSVLPQSLKVGDRKLKANFVGNVSVHSRARGEGHMKELMNRWIEDMQEEVDISFLGGQRQRYEYFGYTLGGIEYQFDLISSNIGHSLRDVSIDQIKLLPLSEIEGGFDFAYTLNENRLVSVARDVSIIDKILRTYQQEAWGMLKNDRLVGYFVCNSEKTEIKEIGLENNSDIKALIKYLFTHMLNKGQELRVELAAYEIELIDLLVSFAESFSQHQAINTNILNFSKVLQAYLHLKNDISALSDGQLTAYFDQQAITITVENGQLSIVEEAEENAVHFNKMEAQNLLLNTLADKKGLKIPSDWFPLPIFHYISDRF